MTAYTFSASGERFTILEAVGIAALVAITALAVSVILAPQVAGTAAGGALVGIGTKLLAVSLSGGVGMS